MLKYVTDTKDEERAFLPYEHDGKDEVVLLVNNLYVASLPLCRRSTFPGTQADSCKWRHEPA